MSLRDAYRRQQTSQLSGGLGSGFTPTQPGDPNFSYASTPDSQAQYPAAAAQNRQYENMTRSRNFLMDAQAQGYDISNEQYAPVREAMERGFIQDALTMGERLLGWVDGPRQFINLLLQDVASNSYDVGLGDYWDTLWSGVNDREDFRSRTGLDPVSGSATLELFGWEEEEHFAGRMLRGVADFTLSVAIDPLTYVTFGASAVGKKVLRETANVLSDEVTGRVLAMAGKAPGWSKAGRAAMAEAGEYEHLLLRQLDDITVDFQDNVLRNLDDERIAALGKYFESKHGVQATTAQEIIDTSYQHVQELALRNRIANDVLKPLLSRDFRNVAEAALPLLPKYAHGGARLSLPFSTGLLEKGIDIPGTRGLGRAINERTFLKLKERLKIFPSMRKTFNWIENIGLHTDVEKALHKGLASGDIAGWQYSIFRNFLDGQSNVMQKQQWTELFNQNARALLDEGEKMGITDSNVLWAEVMKRMEGMGPEGSDFIGEGFATAFQAGKAAVRDDLNQLDAMIGDMANQLYATTREYADKLALALGPEAAKRMLRDGVPHVLSKEGQLLVAELAANTPLTRETILAAGEGGVILAELLHAYGRGGRIETALGTTRGMGNDSIGVTTAAALIDNGTILINRNFLESAATKPLVQDSVITGVVERHYMSVAEINDSVEALLKKLAEDGKITLPRGFNGRILNENPLEVVGTYIDNMTEAIQTWQMIDSLKSAGLAMGHKVGYDIADIAQGMYKQIYELGEQVTKTVDVRPASSKILEEIADHPERFAFHGGPRKIRRPMRAGGLAGTMHRAEGYAKGAVHQPAVSPELPLNYDHFLFDVLNPGGLPPLPEAEFWRQFDALPHELHVKRAGGAGATYRIQLEDIKEVASDPDYLDELRIKTHWWSGYGGDLLVKVEDSEELLDAWYAYQTVLGQAPDSIKQATPGWVHAFRIDELPPELKEIMQPSKQVADIDGIPISWQLGGKTINATEILEVSWDTAADTAWIHLHSGEIIEFGSDDFVREAGGHVKDGRVVTSTAAGGTKGYVNNPNDETVGEMLKIIEDFERLESKAQREGEDVATFLRDRIPVAKDVEDISVKSAVSGWQDVDDPQGFLDDDEMFKQFGVAEVRNVNKTEEAGRRQVTFDIEKMPRPTIAWQVSDDFEDLVRVARIPETEDITEFIIPGLRQSRDRAKTAWFRTQEVAEKLGMDPEDVAGNQELFAMLGVGSEGRRNFAGLRAYPEGDKASDLGETMVQALTHMRKTAVPRVSKTIKNKVEKFTDDFLGYYDENGNLIAVVSHNLAEDMPGITWGTLHPKGVSTRSQVEASIALFDALAKGPLKGKLTYDFVTELLANEVMSDAGVNALWHYLNRLKSQFDDDSLEVLMKGKPSELTRTELALNEFESTINKVMAGYAHHYDVNGSMVRNPKHALLGDEEFINLLNDGQRLAEELEVPGLKQIFGEANRKTMGLAETPNFVNPSLFALGGPAVDELIVQKDIAAWMRQLARNSASIYTPQGVAALKLQTNAVLRWWRGMATVARPAFHVRNLVGGVWQNMIIGVRSRDYLMVRNNALAIRNGIKSKKYNSFAEAIDAVVTDKHANAVFHAALENDVMAGFVTSEFRRLNTADKASRWATFNMFDSDNFGLLKMGASFMESTEDFMRMSAFARWYDPKRPGTAKVAKEMVEAVHFNYSKLTPFETRVKSIVPFFVWMRRNLPLQLQVYAENPRLMQRYNHMMQAIDDQFATATEGELPEGDQFGAYAAGTNYYVNPGTPFWGRVMIDPDLPIKDFLELPMPNPAAMAEFVTNMLGPQFQTLIDVNAQREMGDVNAPAPFNTILKSLAAVGFFDTTQSGDVRIPYWLRSVIETGIPITRDVIEPLLGGPTDPGRQARLGIGQDAGPLESVLKGVGATLARGLGVKLTTPADARSAAFRSQDQLDAAIAGLRFGGEGPPSTNG